MGSEFSLTFKLLVLLEDVSETASYDDSEPVQHAEDDCDQGHHQKVLHQLFVNLVHTITREHRHILARLVALSAVNHFLRATRVRHISVAQVLCPGLGSL